jgi:3-hydroxyisobutyrate dehydrogenase-like beta-hydroxyacid dehydrogenase
MGWYLDKTMRAAIVGVGTIGREWASHLYADGVLGACWNRTPREDIPAFEPVLAAVASRAELLHLVVSDEQAVRGVVEALLPTLTPSHLVLQSTTIDPVTSRDLKEMVTDVGASYLEAPFTGSLPAARVRQTVFYMGGEEEVVERAIPYLSRLSKRRFHLGTNEQACTFKLVMNLQIMAATAALTEGLTLARRAGISDDGFFSAFRENIAFSGVASLKEEKLRQGDYSVQFSTNHMAKDLRLLSGVADSLLPSSDHHGFLRELRALLEDAKGRGFGEADFSSVLSVWEG